VGWCYSNAASPPAAGQALVRVTLRCMPAGKATGPDRDFQMLCRDICVKRFGGAWRPYRDTDGIDVPFHAAGTTWTYDVVLENDAGELLVAECKRWGHPVPQGEVGKLAHTIECLRKETGIGVSGIVFAKTDVQLGGLAHAWHEGIEVVISPESQPLPAFGLTVLKYDPERERRLHVFLECIVESITVTDHYEAVLIRADGSRE